MSTATLPVITCSQTSPDIRSTARTSLLLVDDDDAVRTSLCRGLEMAGLHVEGAADGNQALARLRTGAFDWVVTDIFMPNCEGLELVRILRKRYSHIRIVAMSGRVDSEFLRVARRLGASHILQKPFTYAELVALIEG